MLTPGGSHGSPAWGKIAMAYLTAVETDAADRQAWLVRSTLAEAMRVEIDRGLGVYAIEGRSGARYRWFINTLVRRLGNAAYLEVGSGMGSTLCAAIHGNSVRALAIDDWSRSSGVKDAFLSNLAQFRTSQAEVGFIENDFRRVDFIALAQQVAPFDIYLFDGPQDRHDSLVRVLPALAESFVFICDDWNRAQVRTGTRQAISDSGLELLASAEIRTTLDNSLSELRFRESDWHDGYFIAVLRKPGATPSLEQENAVLRRLVAKLSLEKQALQGSAA
jgi:hypothetical protein